jgi:hypothetical protein
MSVIRYFIGCPSIWAYRNLDFLMFRLELYLLGEVEFHSYHIKSRVNMINVVFHCCFDLGQ